MLKYKNLKSQFLGTKQGFVSDFLLVPPLSWSLHIFLSSSVHPLTPLPSLGHCIHPPHRTLGAEHVSLKRNTPKGDKWVLQAHRKSLVNGTVTVF